MGCLEKTEGKDKERVGMPDGFVLLTSSRMLWMLMIVTAMINASSDMSSVVSDGVVVKVSAALLVLSWSSVCRFCLCLCFGDAFDFATDDDDKLRFCSCSLTSLIVSILWLRRRSAADSLISCP